MSEPVLVHNSAPLAALLEQLRADGVPISWAPETWRFARDGYAWQFVRPKGHSSLADSDGTYRLLRILAVRPGSVTLLVRNPEGIRTVLRTLPHRPACLEAAEPSPHLVCSTLLPCGNTLAREYLRSTSLPDLLDRLPCNRIDRLLHVARRIVSALRSVPTVRWLTPSNTFVDAFDRIVFVDTALHGPDGVRRLFESGRRSPPYFDWIAPEILYRGQVERLSSLAYSVAAVVWQGLLGSPPPKHPPQDGEQVRWRLKRQLAPLAGMPGRLRDFLLRNCSPEPEERFRTLEELDETLAALERARVRVYGTFVALRREGFPWLRRRPKPKPRGTWTPTARVACAATLLACAGFALASALPQDLAARAARTLGLTPRSLPLALPRPGTAHPEPARTTAVAVRTSDELTAAIGSAGQGTRIRLVSPGPFVVDNAELTGSVRIEGDEGILPLLLVTGRYGLRVAAERLQLENVHIVVPSSHPVEAAIVFSGRTLLMRNCSLQTWFSSAASGRDVAAVACVRPDPNLDVTLENVYVRGFAPAVNVTVTENARVRLSNVTLAGCDLGVRVEASLVAGARNAVSLNKTTVVGGELIEVLYRPGFETGALVDLEAHSVLALPLDRKTPLLAVSYPTAFGRLLSHLSWSGERVVVPSAARMLRIRFGRSGRAFVVDGTAQWARFWGDGPAGVIGLPLPFAASLPPGVALRSALGSAVAGAGADAARHRVPDVTTLARALEATLGKTTEEAAGPFPPPSSTGRAQSSPARAEQQADRSDSMVAP